jgi:hypothetical protein
MMHGDGSAMAHAFTLRLMTDFIWAYTYLRLLTTAQLFPRRPGDLALR